MKKEITIEVDPEIGVFMIAITSLLYDTLIEKCLATFGELSPRMKTLLKTKEGDIKEFLDELFHKLRDSATIEEDLLSQIVRHNKHTHIT